MVEGLVTFRTHLNGLPNINDDMPRPHDTSVIRQIFIKAPDGFQDPLLGRLFG